MWGFFATKKRRKRKANTMGIFDEVGGVGGGAALWEQGELGAGRCEVSFNGGAVGV